VFISVVEKHKTKFQLITKKHKYTMTKKLNQEQKLNKHDVSSCVYYRFVFTDEKNDQFYTIVKIDKKDDELAIATFEYKHPNKKWYRFEIVT
jgi:hypothetical protein